VSDMKRIGMERMKPVHELVVSDFNCSPVWQYEDDESGELTVRTVQNYPISSLENRVVGAKIAFANGLESWALIANFDLFDKKKNRHFLSLTFFDGDEQVYTLPRYFDVGYERAIQSELSGALQLEIAEIFPISFDLTSIVIGDSSILSGFIDLVPESERLNDEDLVLMALS
jgi:hypothetical protein